MIRKILPFFVCLLCALPGRAQPPQQPDFVRERGPLVAIEHVTVIDGTGAVPRTNQTLLIDHDRIAAIGADGTVRLPEGTRAIDGRGKTVIPGLVGMHEHMFRPASIDGPFIANEMFVTFPQLYLASGVTTARTGGSTDPYGDLGIRREIEAGRMVGPDLDLTTPYLEGAPPAIPQLYPLRNPEDARALVRYWASLGFTSAKAYMNISPAELAAAIDEAHRHNMKITGHICSVGYEEAARLGIDNLEHGPFGAPDGELDAERAPGLCAHGPGQSAGPVIRNIVQNVAPDSPEVTRMIRTLVEHRVAITPTLAVFEGGDRPNLDRAVARPRAAGRPGQRVVEARHLDQIIAAELLLGVGIRAVEHLGLAIVRANRGGGARALEPLAAAQHASLLHRLGVGDIGRHLGAHVALDRLRPGFVAVDHVQSGTGVLYTNPRPLDQLIPGQRRSVVINGQNKV